MCIRSKLLLLVFIFFLLFRVSMYPFRLHHTKRRFRVFIATAKARCTHYVHIYFHMLVKHMRNRASLEFRHKQFFRVCAAWLLFSLLYQAILFGSLLFSLLFISFAISPSLSSSSSLYPSLSLSPPSRSSSLLSYLNPSIQQYLVLSAFFSFVSKSNLFRLHAAPEQFQIILSE